MPLTLLKSLKEVKSLADSEALDRKGRIDYTYNYEKYLNLKQKQKQQHSFSMKTRDFNNNTVGRSQIRAS